MSIFVKIANYKESVSKEVRSLDSICVTVSFGNVCLFRMFIVIDASV